MKYNIAISLITVILLNGCGSNGTTLKKKDGDNQLNLTIPSTISINENQKSVLSKITDKTGIDFTIIGGEDASIFKINSQTGELTFITPPDFEDPKDANKDNQYIVTIQARKGNLNTTKSIKVEVKDDVTDNGPTFMPPFSKSIEENKLIPETFKIIANNAVKFEISGGDDKNLFKINNDGHLQFYNFIPDYEHSSDKNHDNNYAIDIKATDDSNNSSIHQFIIQVTDDQTEQIDNNTHRFVYKTGELDGPGASGQPFGDDRTFEANLVGNDRTIKVGQRIWEDSPHSKQVKLTYDEAIQYCAQLSYANKNDWRVPSRHELYEIIDHGQMPKIDNIFQNITDGIYWTSQSVLNHDRQPINTAFAISFRDGVSDPEEKNTNHYVRCVSGPQHENITRLSKDNNDVYTDPSTGLQWAKDVSGGTWDEDKNLCENLTFAGKSDWRLPNINELHSIMPVYYEEFLLDGAVRGPFWSSTTIDPTHAMYVSNYWDSSWTDAEGRDVLDDSTEPKTANYLGSICVRGGHL